MDTRIKMYQEYLKLGYSGVYVLINKRLNTFYVGQSKKLIDRLKSHIVGNTKESIIEIIGQADTRLHVGIIDKDEFSPKDFDLELRTYEYATYIHMKNKGYKSLNSEFGFNWDCKERYSKEDKNICIEKFINFDIDLFGRGFKECVLGSNDYYKSKKIEKEKAKLISENEKLRNEILKANILKNGEDISRALKLYLNKIIKEDKLILLIVYSECRIDKILEIINEGTIDTRLVNAINKLVDADLAMLLGDSKLSKFDESKLNKYYQFDDKEGVVKRLYDAIGKAHMQQRMFNVGGSESKFLVERAIREEKITLNVRGIFEAVFGIQWDRLKKYDFNQLLKILNDISRKEVRKKTISFIDILEVNGMVEQISDYVYDVTKGNSTTEFMENSKLISLIRLNVKGIYSYDEYKEMFVHYFINGKYISNYLIVNEIEKYRFCERIYNEDDDGYFGSGYFILDYNDVIKCEDNEYSTHAYEVDLKTFYYFTSRISAYRGNLEIINLRKEAEENLKKLTNEIGMLIKYEKEKLELVEAITKK